MATGEIPKSIKINETTDEYGNVTSRHTFLVGKSIRRDYHSRHFYDQLGVSPLPPRGKWGDEGVCYYEASYGQRHIESERGYYPNGLLHFEYLYIGENLLQKTYYKEEKLVIDCRHIFNEFGLDYLLSNFNANQLKNMECLNRYEAKVKEDVEKQDQLKKISLFRQTLNS
jgi:hypothetical protein